MRGSVKDYSWLFSHLDWIAGPGVRKKSKSSVKDTKKKGKGKKTKSKSGQSSKRKKASSVRMTLYLI